jgi:hypothetical protein
MTANDYILVLKMLQLPSGAWKTAFAEFWDKIRDNTEITLHPMPIH